MSTITNKIDFALVISVKNANPNGDPLNGNRPRNTYENYGEISDVCIKRKIRNRLMQEGKSIFVQSDDNKLDEFQSLSDRFNAKVGKIKDKKEIYNLVCSEWLDVRAFGQVFAFKGSEKEGVSIGVRGPVSIQPAFSVDPISITSTQITKSVNSEPGDKKGSDTMGMKHRVDFAIYTTFGSINVELANKTGFSDDDKEAIKYALRTLFRNDTSSARPEGSMEVVRLVWWEHNNAVGQYPSAKVHRTFKVVPKTDTPSSIDDYNISIEPLDSLSVEVIDGE